MNYKDSKLMKIINGEVSSFLLLWLWMFISVMSVINTINDFSVGRVFASSFAILAVLFLMYISVLKRKNSNCKLD